MEGSEFKPEELENELDELDETQSTEDDKPDDSCLDISRPDADEVASLFGPGVKNVWKSKRKGRGRSGLTAGKQLPLAVCALLSDAHSAYICGDFERAAQLFSEVAKAAPKHPDAYMAMALIYEESGDSRTALQLFAVAAKYTPKAQDLWLKVADTAYKIGELEQALAAINRVCLTVREPEVAAKRIILLVENDDITRAESFLRNFLRTYPSEYAFLLDYGTLCSRRGFRRQATQALLSWAEKIERNEHRMGGEMDQQQLCEGLMFACRTVAAGYLYHQVLSSHDFPASPDCAKQLRELRMVLKVAQGAAHNCDGYTNSSGQLRLPFDISLALCVVECESAIEQQSEDEQSARTAVTKAVRMVFPLLGLLRDEESIIRAGMASRADDEAVDDDAWLRGSVLTKGGQGDKENEDTVKITDGNTGEVYGEVPVRDIDDWEYFLLCRSRLSALLARMGFVRQSMSLSREMSNSPMLLSKLLSPRTTAALLLSHCRLLQAHTPDDQRDDTWYQELILICTRTLQADPNDVDALLLFHQLCAGHRSDLLCEARDMLAVHFLALLAEFQGEKSTSTALRSARRVEGATSVTEGVFPPINLMQCVRDMFDVAGGDTGELEREDREVGETEDEGRVHPEDDAESNYGEDVEEEQHVEGPGGGDSGRTLTQDEMVKELRAILYWAKVAREENGDTTSFCCVVLPILEAYNNQRRNGRQRQKQRPVSLSLMWSEQSVVDYQVPRWLGDTQGYMARMVFALAQHTRRLRDVASEEHVIFMAREIANDLSISGDPEAEQLCVRVTTALRELGSDRTAEQHMQSSLGYDEAFPTSGSRSKRRRDWEFDDDDYESIPDLLKEFVDDVSNMSSSAGKLAWTVMRDPFDIDAANLLCQELRNCTSSLIFENVFPTAAFVRHYPDSAIGWLLSGHDGVLKCNNTQVLDAYLRAFVVDPHQPLTSLCLLSSLIYVSTHSQIKNKQETCAKALLFFSHYAKLRLRSQEANGDSAEQYIHLCCMQEVYYNLATMYRDIRLNHLAENMLIRALKVCDGRCETDNELPLTKVAAFNLVTLYKCSGNLSLAYDVMKKYLNLDM